MINRLLHNKGFRLLIITTACFSLACTLLGIFISVRMQNTLESQIRTHILQEARSLLVDYEQDGLPELLHDVRERFELRDIDNLLYALRSPDGKVLFDKDIVHERSSEDWYHTSHNPAVLVNVTRLENGYALFVGERLTAIDDLKVLLRNNVLLFLGCTVLLSLVTGLLVTRNFMARVDEVTTATRLVGRHSLSNRLPVSPANDDFDRLAVAINGMLERIETLVHEIRHVTNSVAHDLRTPLSRVRQELELLSATSDKDAARIERTISMLDGTLSTFTAMLQLAELESDPVPRQLQTVSLSNLVTNIVDLYRPDAEEEGQTLLLQEGQIPDMRGDPSLLNQLIVNLVENAISYSGENSTVRIELSKDNHDNIILKVSDNGPGVSVDDAKKLLQPFFRADRSRTTSGTGLGLSIVKAIASLHNGEVKLNTSGQGLGVKVTFRRQLNSG
ncbi:HAMP domain-containing sensor histidine kinase [Alteromonas sp. 1_MG-2023]|uniref:sensor histidine kinase n=1 Tax=Alteromonas sp. 1_MG-2023 TaxID=3062669 RepID=UPI0026E411B4|nr:HAMP domain-containing sensor histidine kinase [Alteromonas sp. 1_MG-2023]MDO6477313.1 HAMP domain-containing sensor histidine kinase [Alteromonas sp. 1_MG-2023]